MGSSSTLSPWRKTGDSASLKLSNPSSPASDAEALVEAPAFPLVAFFWPARASVSQWEILPIILMVVGLFRWVVGLWGYSGFQKPPMHGDYEAQRHWMELTTHLPVSQWYFHDLEWWGLDYPPLTAYHSWLCGRIGALVEPSWFALYKSRGTDDPMLKIFMRATVLVSECLVYIPAMVIFTRRFSRLSGVSNWSASMVLVAILMQPATILIDHGHFQYNTVMLGLVLASMSSLLAGRDLWAAVFFVAALGFKQMALYYALAVFSYLMGICIFPRIRPAKFLAIALTTLVSSAVLVLPLVAGTIYDVVYHGITPRPGHKGPPALPLLPDIAQHLDPGSLAFAIVEQLVQMMHRIFPFARGLFEDKVANFWCALNVVVKLHHYPADMLQCASLLATMLSIIPPNLMLFWKPQKTALPLAFAATAWGFFLFSYQVHEKSVLIPLMPMTLLLAGKQGLGKTVRAWVGFANILACWTMFPLLQREDLRVPYTVMTLLWAYLLGLPPTSPCAYAHDGTGAVSIGFWMRRVVHACFYLAMALWHAVEATIAPPSDKPDLWVVLNVGVGAAGFGLCYLWCLWRLAVQTDILPQSFWPRIPRIPSKGKKMEKKTQ